jgi:hypothetical protein
MLSKFMLSVKEPLCTKMSMFWTMLSGLERFVYISGNIGVSDTGQNTLLALSTLRDAAQIISVCVRVTHAHHGKWDYVAIADAFADNFDVNLICVNAA